MGALGAAVMWPCEAVGAKRCWVEWGGGCYGLVGYVLWVGVGGTGDHLQIKAIRASNPR